MQGLQWIKLLKMIQQAYCVKLIIRNISNAQLIPALVQPFYCKLNQLNISNCLITSVQNISFLNAPRLLTLNLSYNHIDSLKGLVKLESKSLQVLNLYDNTIRVITVLSRLKVGKTRKQFNIDFRVSSLNSFNKSLSNVQDLSQIAKLQRNKNSKMINYPMYNISNSTQRNQLKNTDILIQALRRKYSKITQQT